ncbi:hypothetical protein C0992_005721 [Termitomyces sp. T32_za158]|nr:hypothetical protein C0992_005721 [Termitomyces sp. T32_za158]
MAVRYPTPTTRWAPPNLSTPLCPSNPTCSPSIEAMSAPDHSVVLPSAKDPQSTGTRVPPITPTTPKYSLGDSPKPHPKIGTPFPLRALDPLPQEPTTLAPPQLPPPDMTHSDTRAL